MNLNRRNYPPDMGIRLPAEEMKALTVRLFEAVGMPVGDAEVLGHILNINDRRCLFSHGTRQVPYYLQKIKDGDFFDKKTSVFKRGRKNINFSRQWVRYKCQSAIIGKIFSNW